MAIYNLEAVQAKRRNMALACAGFYAAIIGCFALGHYLRGSWHIGGWLYPMLALYSVHMIYCVLMIRKETHKRRRMLRDPHRHRPPALCTLFVRECGQPLPCGPCHARGHPFHHHALYLWPLGTDGHSFLRSYVHLFGYGLYAVRRTAGLGGGRTGGGTGGWCFPPTFRSVGLRRGFHRFAFRTLSALRGAHCPIQERIDSWCVQRGYKDYSINFMTLSRSLSISKADLAVYFSQRLHTKFRVWLSDIRFRAAQSMMLEHPHYSNDVISAECGFSSRTQLYRIFKAKVGCTPTAWRERQSQQDLLGR